MHSCLDSFLLVLCAIFYFYFSFSLPLPRLLPFLPLSLFSISQPFSLSVSSSLSSSLLASALLCASLYKSKFDVYAK